MSQGAFSHYHIHPAPAKAALKLADVPLHSLHLTIQACSCTPAVLYASCAFHDIAILILLQRHECSRFSEPSSLHGQAEALQACSHQELCDAELTGLPPPELQAPVSIAQFNSADLILALS